MNTPPVKPMVLSFNEAKQDVINAINQILQTYGMPIFMLEIIIKELHEEIKMSSDAEKQAATEQYNRALAEYEASQTTIEEETKSEN